MSLLRRIAAWHPFLWLGGFAMVLMLIGPYLPFDYDDGGLGSVIFAVTYVATTPFRYASRLTEWVTGAQSGATFVIVTTLIGGAIYVLADLALNRMARGSGSAQPQA